MELDDQWGILIDGRSQGMGAMDDDWLWDLFIESMRVVPLGAICFMVHLFVPARRLPVASHADAVAFR